LVVDDAAHIRRLVAAAFAGTDYAVIEAADAVEGLRVARRERPEVVLVDLAVPIEDGLDLCRQIRSHPSTRRAVIVLTTAMTVADLPDLARSVDADGVQCKPFSPLELVEAVRALVRDRP
jgi:DNA-binding response OmpR family regulator